jgi:hypothetical protein
MSGVDAIGGMFTAALADRVETIESARGAAANGSTALNDT